MKKTVKRRGSKTLIASIIVTFLIVGLFAFFYSNGSLTGKVVEQPLNIEELNQEIPVPGQPYEPTPTDIPKSDYQIKIVNFAYSPAQLEIPIGATVSWENKDITQHTITSKTGTELDSPLFGKSEFYVHTFTKPGIYEYYCKPHPYMQGTIIVR